VSCSVKKKSPTSVSPPSICSTRKTAPPVLTRWLGAAVAVDAVVAAAAVDAVAAAAEVAEVVVAAPAARPSAIAASAEGGALSGCITINDDLIGRARSSTRPILVPACIASPADPAVTRRFPITSRDANALDAPAGAGHFAMRPRLDPARQDVHALK